MLCSFSTPGLLYRFSRTGIAAHETRGEISAKHRHEVRALTVVQNPFRGLHEDLGPHDLARGGAM